MLVDGGNSNIFLIFIPIPGEMIQFDEHIFQMGWFNHQLVFLFSPIFLGKILILTHIFQGVFLRNFLEKDIDSSILRNLLFLTGVRSSTEYLEKMVGQKKKNS